MEILATYQGKSRLASLTVLRPKVKTVTFSPTAVTGSQTATCTVTMESAPLTDTIVDLTYEETVPAIDADSFPVSVTIPAGATKATFPVKTKAVELQNVVFVTARGGGGVVTGKLTVRAPGPSSIGFSQNPLPGGQKADVTVGLNATPIAEVTVVLTSNNNLVTFGGATTTTVVIPAGTSSPMRFNDLITSGKPSLATTVSITATANGVSKSVNLKVNP